MKPAALAMMGGLAGMLMNDPVKVAKIPSHKIEQSEETKHEWSKRTQQKMKGKKARKNRGKNRL